jgi:flagellar assembly protein FliH
LQQAESPTRKAASARIQLFEYPAGPNPPSTLEWERWDGGEELAKSSPDAGGGAGLRTESDRRLAEETRRSFDSGREQGRQEGRKSEREAQAAAEKQRAQKAVEQIASLMRERDRYLASVEEEVVKLSLAVAARILRREAQMDPLLLTGAVRVALGQLAGSTEVRLRVPEADLELWNEAIALVPNLAVKPKVIAGEGMRLGDCVIETGMGSVDLGIRSQLGEIERGFFDRAVSSAERESGA